MQFIKQKDKKEKKYFNDCANYVCEVKLLFLKINFINF